MDVTVKLRRWTNTEGNYKIHRQLRVYNSDYKSYKIIIEAIPASGENSILTFLNKLVQSYARNGKATLQNVPNVENPLIATIVACAIWTMVQMGAYVKFVQE